MRLMKLILYSKDFSLYRHLSIHKWSVHTNTHTHTRTQTFIHVLYCLFIYEIRLETKRQLKDNNMEKQLKHNNMEKQLKPKNILFILCEM